MLQKRKVIIDGREHSVIITDILQAARDAKERNLTLICVENEDNKGVSFPKCECIIDEDTVITKDFLLKMCQRHNGLPWTIAETKRLIIRELAVADIERLHPELFIRMGEDGKREKLSGAVARTLSYIEKIYSLYGFGIWAIVDKSSGEIIGKAGLDVKNENDFPELGYHIIEERRREGLATEALRAVLEYAKKELNIDKICCNIENDNAASIKLSQKLNDFCFNKGIELNINIL